MIAILKDTSIYAIGEILGRGIGFLAVVFYTHFITQIEIGVYGYIMVIVSFTSTIMTLGADNAYARYFFEYKKKKAKATTYIYAVFLFGFMDDFHPVNAFSFR